MKRILVIAMFLIATIAIFYITPNYEKNTFYEKSEIRLVIDDTDVTKKLDAPVISKDGKILLSQNTIDIYFDKWFYYDEEYDTYITTSDSHIAKMKVDSNTIKVDGKDINISVPAQKIDEVIYIPIEELTDVYNIEVLQDDKIIITTENSQKATIKVDNKKIKLKALNKAFSRTTGKALVGETLDLFRFSKDKEWIWARNSKGDLGYVSIKDLENYDIPEYVEVEKETEKINLIWEYASNFTPNRDEKKVKELDVIAPTWINLASEDGELKNTISSSYVKWAHSEGYKVWATFKNDGFALEKTSANLSDMKTREKIIESVINLCLKNDIDGINLDFENMLKNDSKLFSEFVRELAVECRRNNLKISVDVTVPDGSPTWSLCYDRYELADVVDYIILMAYDQYGVGSSVAGSVATYNWVRANVEKMVIRDNIESRKLILGVPLYSRVWSMKDGKKTKNPISLPIKDNQKYLESENTKWLVDERQYYYEVTQNGVTTMAWLENDKSIIEKLKLIEEFDLAGAAFWRWGYESESLWNEISDYLKY